jgi:hypothetical protein
VEIRGEDEPGREADFHPEDGLERRAGLVPVAACELDSRERRDKQCSISERAPAKAELTHRAATRLAFQNADRGNAGEHERDRAADPDRGGEQVDDDEDFLHGGHTLDG